MKIHPLQIRNEMIRLDKYSRVKKNGRKESVKEVIGRVVWGHQRYLWERALNRKLLPSENAELTALERSMLRREQSCAGRTLWLGGTPLSKEIEVTQFNCAFAVVKTVRDVVDFYWLLLNGCGVGGKPSLGLTGFKHKLKVEVICSSRTTKGGYEKNIERWCADSKTWHISVGDSAEAWSKFIGKVLAHPYPAKKLVLDFSAIRPPGIRLSRYGWISSGDGDLIKASTAIAKILNHRHGDFLSKIDILDILTWLGTTLSSRRSAELMMLDSNDVEINDFMGCKSSGGNFHRHQANNSVVYYNKPASSHMADLIEHSYSTGENGIINGALGLLRAPWFEGLNPCGETLLMSHSLCNLHEMNISAFNNINDLRRAIWLGARANYRQTLVSLNDGILQENWDRNNQTLRLCGLSITGVQSSDLLTGVDKTALKRLARGAAFSMAKELRELPPKATTLMKPSGTLSKAMFNGASEGIHFFPSEYLFNNINISSTSPAFKALSDANFDIIDHPTQSGACLVKFPVDNSKNYKPMPSAIHQLENYKDFLLNWCDHNVSTTITLAREEIKDVASWMSKNWDDYLSVTFFPRQEIGNRNNDYAYNPQEITNKDTFLKYVSKLKTIDSGELEHSKISDMSDCDSGGCPVN